MVEIDGDRPARAALVDAQAGPPGGGHGTPQIAYRSQQRVPSPALPAGQGLELADLLEGVDDHLRVAPDRQRNACVSVFERREVSVAQVPLRRRARGDDRAALGE